jgi:HAD superfamily hydrolase (TIGR01450 family)
MASHTILPGLGAEPVKHYRAVLCDLDGCLIAGGRALPGAVDFARELADRLWIVSNNSSDTAGTLAAKLKDFGIEIPEARILLAGEQAVDHLARKEPGAGLRCLTDAPIRERAERAGFDLAPVKADYVLLGRMAAFNLACLEQAVADLTEGACLLAANADRIHPGPAGHPVPETGAWLAAVKACLPGVDFDCFGKPATHLPAEALRRSGTTAGEAVFIGDNPETDGLAARRLGIDFIEINRFAGTGEIPPGPAPGPAEMTRC